MPQWIDIRTYVCYPPAQFLPLTDTMYNKVVKFNLDDGQLRLVGFLQTMQQLGVWRSSCWENGAPCVIMVLVLQRLMLPAGNWDFLMLLDTAMLANLGKSSIAPEIICCHLTTPSSSQ